MNTHRAVSVLLAVLAATMLVTGSFGFTSVSAERGVAINVVESENAYVGVSVCRTGNGSNGNDSNGANPVKVTVTNQFSEEFTVESISWGDPAHPQKDEKRPIDAQIGVGETKTFSGAFGDEDVTVEVGGGLDATVTVELTGNEECSPGKKGTNDEDDKPESGETDENGDTREKNG